MVALVSVKNLSKKFGNFTAVENVSFSVDKGEVLGFLGPNGAGKSTTMRMATGYLPPTEGTVTICGHDILENPLEAQKQIGYLPEGGPLYNDMTAASFLKFIAQIRGLKGSKLKERMDYVIENLHLNNVYYQSIETLSKGYKRRVALAQAIIHDPAVLILDEPTDGLDPNQKFEVQKLISSMAKDKVIIISTHILEEVEAICSRTLIISHGKIVSSGTPQELAAKAADHNCVVVTLKKAPTKKIIDGLKKVKGVEDVEKDKDNECRLLVRPKAAKPIVGPVSKSIHAENVEIEELYAISGNLNDAFRLVTTSGSKGEELS